MNNEQFQSREDRIARNEALFREVNERVHEVSSAGPADRIEFLCECGSQSCTATVPLESREYEEIRADPLLFVVKPGHDVADVEDVAVSNDRYEVVRKHAEEAAIARQTHPRR